MISNRQAETLPRFAKPRGDLGGAQGAGVDGDRREVAVKKLRRDAVRAGGCESYGRRAGRRGTRERLPRNWLAVDPHGLLEKVHSIRLRHIHALDRAVERAPVDVDVEMLAHDRHAPLLPPLLAPRQRAHQRRVDEPHRGKRIAARPALLRRTPRRAGPVVVAAARAPTRAETE